MKRVINLFSSIAYYPRNSCLSQLNYHSRQYGLTAIRYNESVQDEASDNYHVNLIKRVETLRPDNDYIANLSDESKKKLDHCLKELEIFVYISRFVPESLEPNNWDRIISSGSLSDRVAYLHYVAVSQKRSRQKDETFNRKSEEYSKYLEEEQKRFNRGEMAYGSGMYQLIANPFRNKKRLRGIESSRIVSAIRNGYPEIAIDMQYLFNDSSKHIAELTKQLRFLISNNFSSRSPLSLNFFNFPKTDGADEWLTKDLGFYDGVYKKQTLLPEFKNEGLNEAYPKDKEIVYFSKHAREVIDGPLTADVYALCLSMDHKRESIGAARRAGVRAVTLPIRKYIKWESGPMFLPFPNFLHVLREVHASGGDWETALLKNIAKRHLVTPGNPGSEYRVALYKEKRREREEIIQMIRDGTEQLT